jgi:colicin import membrane protein
MRARLLSLLAVIAAIPAWAAEQNVITSVEVKDAGSEVVLSVKGTRKPSFTTFSMADPPRFVIDFSESKFQGVPEEAKGAGGVVQLVKCLSYGAGVSSIARIMIAFSAEVDPPAVEEAPDGLVVRIAKPGGAAVAAAPEPASQAKPDAAALALARADAEAKAAADAKAKADSDAQAQAQAQADAKAKAEADAKAKADSEALAAADAKARAEADAKAQADAKAKADAEAKAQAQADAKAQADARVRADAEAKAQAQADAKAAADAKAKAEADAKAQAKADAEARAAADAKAKADAKAEADAKAAAEAKAKADAEAQAKADAAAAGTADEDAEQRALEAEIAAARSESAAPAAPAPGVEKLAPKAPAGLIREVGFKQLPDASRVFVRASSPPQFTVQEVDDRTVRIEVANAKATRRNDLRFLDTSFFASAVQLVTPSRQGTSYVLTVKLRQRVPYQQRVEGDMLVVDFQRPPTTAAAGSAPPRDMPAADTASEEKGD